MRNKKLRVLSLFDGMSCGRIALEKAGIEVEEYYASEIDKYAMQVSAENYPESKQLGSVIDLTDEQLKELGEIDLLIGGSPCQGFSVSGKMKGSATKCGKDVTTLEQYLVLKEMDFEFEGQSYLFWEYVRVWQIIKPKYFFLENVRVTKKWLPMFNEAMGVEPIMINSALVSAQNRVRFYWTNIPNLSQPEDRGILLKDVLESEEATKESGKLFNVYGTGGKSPCLTTDIKGQEAIKRVYADSGKSPALTTMQGGHRQPKVLIVPEATKKGYTEIQDGDCFDYAVPNSKTRRGRNMKDKSNCLQTSNGFMRYKYPTYRKLTPLECERLQTVPENYTSCVSNSQRYKMLGNGWTVDVIVHLFKGLKK